MTPSWAGVGETQQQPRSSLCPSLGHPRPHPGPILASQREEAEGRLPHTEPEEGMSPSPPVSPTLEGLHSAPVQPQSLRIPFQTVQRVSASLTQNEVPSSFPTPLPPDGITGPRSLPPSPAARSLASSEATWAGPGDSLPNEMSFRQFPGPRPPSPVSLHNSHACTHVRSLTPSDTSTMLTRSEPRASVCSSSYHQRLRAGPSAASYT